MEKSAYNLIEILITLVLLGIISVIVIPNLIKKYQRTITVTKVKRFYANITDAYSQYIILNGNSVPDLSVEYPRTSEGAQKMYNDLIKPYFEISYDAGVDTQRKSIIMDNSAIKLLNGSNYANYTSNNLYYGYQFKDGATGWVRGHGKGLAIAYDVNGKKGPNTLGKDLFIFSINDVNNTEVSPYDQTSGRMTLKEAAEAQCKNKNAKGWHCASWIIAQGNMNYLDCTNLADWTTGKCK